MGFGGNPFGRRNPRGGATGGGGDMSMRGDREVRLMLDGMNARMVRRIVGPLMIEADRMIVAALKGEAPRETGLLALAIGHTPVKHYGDGILFTTVGVRRGFRRAVGHFKRGRVYRISKAKSENTEGPFRNPTKYLHLVTVGRKAVSAIRAKTLYSSQSERFFGKKVAAVAPNPFVTRAFDAVQSGIIGMMESRITTLIENQAAATGGK
jgi:hypothetical protein